MQQGIAAPVFAQASGASPHTDRVRELNRPRGDAGAKTEPGAFVATARATAIAAAALAAVFIAIAAGIIASSIVSWFPSPPELRRPTQAVQHVQLVLALPMINQVHAGREGAQAARVEIGP